MLVIDVDKSEICCSKEKNAECKLMLRKCKVDAVDFLAMPEYNEII